MSEAEVSIELNSLTIAASCYPGYIPIGKDNHLYYSKAYFGRETDILDSYPGLDIWTYNIQHWVKFFPESPLSIEDSISINSILFGHINGQKLYYNTLNVTYLNKKSTILLALDYDKLSVFLYPFTKPITKLTESSIVKSSELRTIDNLLSYSHSLFNKYYKLLNINDYF